MEKEKSLVHKLERDEDGEPILNLKLFSKTGISAPTQEEYLTLMRILECGGLKLRNGYFPTQTDYWKYFKENTCVDSGIGCFRRGLFGCLSFNSKEFYEKKLWRIISMQQLYDSQEQPITSEIIKEINDWFENKRK